VEEGEGAAPRVLKGCVHGAQLEMEQMVGEAVLLTLTMLLRGLEVLRGCYFLGEVEEEHLRELFWTVEAEEQLGQETMSR